MYATRRVIPGMALFFAMSIHAASPPPRDAASAHPLAGLPLNAPLRLPATNLRIDPDADELIPPVPYTATVVALVKTYVVTATYDGKPYRVMSIVVDSEGLVYSSSQQGSARVRDDESGDELDVKVTSLAPVVFDISVKKSDASAFAQRDRVAVDDLPQGHRAFALREKHLAVEVERLRDEVDLR